jgi:predicted PurR-regulated permease PerM
MAPERVVTIRPGTVFSVASILIALAAALWVVYAARHVLTWVLVAVFLAIALDPGVRWLQRRTGLSHRGAAAGIIFTLTLAAIAGLGFLLISPLVDQVRGLADAAPGYVHDLTAGRGPLGFLETKYHVVERVRDATSGGGGALLGGASTALAITKGVLATIAAIVTVAFLTFFMILEGPAWVDRLLSLVPPEGRPRWRLVGGRIAQTVSGYVTGNLLISLIAGTATAVALAVCGVPYALALGLLVAVLDLIPLVGATIAGIVIVTVAALTSITAGVIIAVFFIVYQQIENHLLQPIVYSRTVRLSSLTVLVSVLIGAAVAGIIGALGAIPIAGSLQVLLDDWRQHHGGPGFAAVQPGSAAPQQTLR